jgi:hypothetical protein
MVTVHHINAAKIDVLIMIASARRPIECCRCFATCRATTMIS